MSTLEQFIWYLLGYITMPVIFITGFLITAVIGCFLLERWSAGGRTHSGADDA